MTYPHLSAFIGLFARAVDHDFVASVIGNAGEVLVTLVAPVQNASFLVNGGLVTFEVVTALQVFVTNFAYVELGRRRLGLFSLSCQRQNRAGIRGLDFAVGHELQQLPIDGRRRLTAVAHAQPMDVLLMALEIVAVIEHFQADLAGEIVDFARAGAVDADAMTPEVETVLKVLFAKIAMIRHLLRGIRGMKVLQMAFQIALAFKVFITQQTKVRRFAFLLAVAGFFLLRAAFLVAGTTTSSSSSSSSS